MADKTHSGLTAAGVLDGSEIVPVVQGGNSRRTTAQAIADLGAGGGGGGLSGLTVLRRTSAQTITTGSWQGLSWQTEDYDNLETWSSGAGWTVPADINWMRINGLYMPWAIGTGDRLVSVERTSGTGTAYVAGDMRAAKNETFQSVVSSWVAVVPGDVYQVRLNVSTTRDTGAGFGGFPGITIEWAETLAQLHG